MGKTFFEKLWATMINPIVFVLYFCLVWLVYFYFDKQLAFYFHKLELKSLLPFLTVVTSLGLAIIYLPTFFLAGLLFRYVRKNRANEMAAWFLSLCIVVPGLICGFLKVLFGRARPGMLFFQHIYGFYGLQIKAQYLSFPSGHTTTVMGVALGLSAVFPRYGYVFMLLGSITAVSRVILTQHYLSDVMVASYLSLLEVGLLYFIFKKRYGLFTSTK